MQSSEKISVTLPAEMVRAIREKVASGTYASTSEIVREALRAWQRQQDEHDERMAVIRAKIRRSSDDPRPNLTLDEVAGRLSRLHEGTLAEHGDEAA